MDVAILLFLSAFRFIFD